MSRMPDEDAIAHEFHRTGNLDDGSQMDFRKPALGHNGGPPMDDEEDNRDEDALKEMDLTSIMQRARKAAIIKLTLLVERDQATPADMAVLARLLKDNGMVMGDPFREPRTATPGEPAEEDEPLELPTFNRPEYDPEP